jgi:vacuolar-type H+-ATPase subunit I/STV1
MRREDMAHSRKEDKKGIFSAATPEGKHADYMKKYEKKWDKIEFMQAVDRTLELFKDYSSSLKRAHTREHRKQLENVVNHLTGKVVDAIKIKPEESEKLVAKIEERFKNHQEEIKFGGGFYALLTMVGQKLDDEAKQMNPQAPATNYGERIGILIETINQGVDRRAAIAAGGTVEQTAREAIIAERMKALNEGRDREARGGGDRPAKL